MLLLAEKSLATCFFFCCRYIHVLVQKMAVNVDLGFILSLVDFFSLDQEDLQLEVSNHIYLSLVLTVECVCVTKHCINEIFLAW